MVTALTIAAALMVSVPAASNDGNVEWDGITHLVQFDRIPVVPVENQAFQVKLQTYRADVSSIRVRLNDSQWIDAYWVRNSGPYDIWMADIPETTDAFITYYFEISDGADTDYLGADGMQTTVPANQFWLDFDTYAHAPLGANRSPGHGTVFRVWAEGASSASVRGEFNGWGETAMTPVGSDYVAYVPSATGQTNYKYFFSGNHWSPDARSRRQLPEDFSNSRTLAPDTYGWTDQDFETPPFEEMVVYEMHIGSFSGNNDGLNRSGLYTDVINHHLDHLLYLGVNTLLLMPVTEFDGYESWGYNPVCNYAPEQSYGTPQDYRNMINALHNHGIAVLMDVVYNHFSASGNWMFDYDGTRIYFDDPSCDTPWGAQAAFWKQEVRDYYADNVLFWLEEYHVDGIRMDATSYMRDPNGCYPQGWDLMRRIADEMDDRAVHKLLMLEELPDNQAVTRPTSLGGAGGDTQWHDKWNDDVRQEIFDAGLSDPEMWKVRDAINDSAYPEKTRLTNYVESHDEADDARLPAAIDNVDSYSVYAKGRSKLAQGLTMLAPGIPMFLQGGEWLENIPFGALPGNRIDWSKAVNRAPMVKFFRDVIAIRRGNCALRSDKAFNVHHLNESGNVIAMHRWDGFGNDLVIIANFSNTDYTNYRIGLPLPGVWHEILNSQAGEYDGNGLGNGGSVWTDAQGWDGMPQSGSFIIPQMGLLVFRHENSPGYGSNGDMDFDGDTDLRDYTIMQQRMWDSGCSLAGDWDENGRLTGEDARAITDNMTGPQ